MEENGIAQLQALLTTLSRQESALDRVASRLKGQRDRLNRAWVSEETPAVIAHLDRQISQTTKAARELAALQVDVRQVIEDLRAEAAARAAAEAKAAEEAAAKKAAEEAAAKKAAEEAAAKKAVEEAAAAAAAKTTQAAKAALSLAASVLKKKG